MEKLETLFSLIKSGVFEISVEDSVKNFMTDEKAEELFALADEHDMSHIISYVFDKNGLVSSGEQRKKYRERWLNAVYRYEQMQYELDVVCRVLEEQQIEYIPLKGSVLRAYYPQPWMRTSCDIDIFVRKTDISQAIRALEEKLSYQHTGGCPHDESLYSESGVHLELHHDLIEEHIAGDGTEILNDVWNYTKTADGYSYRRDMTDEMFYFYHIAHMAKHFTSGGCGIRTFLDVWILNHRFPENTAQREQLLEKGGYLAFERAAKRLSEVWLSGAEESVLTKDMEAYVLHGGVYGTLDNRVALQSAQKGSKFAYWMSRIFLPYKQLKLSYPVLQKHKWLTPIFQVVRWFHILFKRDRVKKSLQEMNASTTLTDERREKTAKMLQDLGL